MLLSLNDKTRRRGCANLKYTHIENINRCCAITFLTVVAIYIFITGIHTNMSFFAHSQNTDAISLAIFVNKIGNDSTSLLC